MKNLMSLSFKVYSSIEGNSNTTFLRDMISIQAKVRDYPENHVYYMSKDAREEEESKGLYNISFYMTREEFTAIVEGRSESVTDITHNLRAVGELWTFYDLDFSTKNAGLMRVPFVNVSFPEFCQRVILKAARQIWKASKEHFEGFKASYPKGLSYEQTDIIQARHEIKLSQTRRDNWDRLYGCGKGNVEVIADEKTLDSIHNDTTESYEGERNFADMFGRLRTIALNNTNAFFQTAKLRIYKEYGGKSYGWAAYRPNGNCTLNGGLVDYSREEGKHDWSIHT